MKFDNVQTVGNRGLLTAIRDAQRDGKPIIVAGDPGSGKTQIAQAAARAVGRLEHRVLCGNYSLYNMVGIGSPATMDDGSRVTVFSMPSWEWALRDKIAGAAGGADGHSGGGVEPPAPACTIIWDEVHLMRPEAHGPLLEIWDSNSINGKPLPHDTHHVALINMPENNAAAWHMYSPEFNRTRVVRFIPDPEYMWKWGADSGRFSIEVIEYLKAFGDCIQTFNFDEPLNTTCRSLEDVSNMFNRLREEEPELTEGDLAIRISSAIPMSEANKMLVFVRKIRELTAVDDLLADPKNAPLPKSPADMVMQARLMLAKYSTENCDMMFEYIKRMPSDFQPLFLNMLFAGLEAGRFSHGDMVPAQLAFHDAVISAHYEED